jgi:hypothetical protein
MKHSLKNQSTQMPVPVATEVPQAMKFPAQFFFKDTYPTVFS